MLYEVITIILYQQAIEQYESGQEQAVVWKDLGEAYALIGRWTEAIEAFGQAMELDPRITSYNVCYTKLLRES